MKAADFWLNSSVNVIADNGNGCHPTGATPKSEKDLKRNKVLNFNIE